MILHTTAIVRKRAVILEAILLGDGWQSELLHQAAAVEAFEALHALARIAHQHLGLFAGFLHVAAMQERPDD